jgi:hypothetical protein
LFKLGAAPFKGFIKGFIDLVILHRYLGMRLKNYSYDRNFSGIFYLFIQGMHPEYPSPLLWQQ